MADFQALPSAEVLTPSGHEYHARGMQFFHMQLADLNSGIFVMEHVIAFPHHLFVSAHDSIFFRLVFNNFFTSSVLTITRLLTDQGARFFTLPRFKNRIRSYVKPQFSAQFDAYLRPLRFDRTTNALLRKAEGLRNSRLAHIVEEEVFSPNPQEALAFAELRALRDRTNSLLQALAFDTDLLMLPLHYSERVQHPPGSDARPDIEKLLDMLALHSATLNRPEQDPALWAIDRRYLSEADLAQINHYRAKFQLPRV